MIECIFTIDYEIYGNGDGSLKELVYDPAERLQAVFKKAQARFVVFVEAAELEMIEAKGTDPSIDLVERQIRDLYKDGHEIGLHLHPQWYNARYENGSWQLDYGEYNLCTLSQSRIADIVERAISYLRRVLGAPTFNPISFRAGNWLFQPTQPASQILAERGIKVDSSVFKGGLRHQHGLDYRRALKNGHCWKYADRVDVATSNGTMLELPIHTRMVPLWQMLTAKRMVMEGKGYSSSMGDTARLHRIRDLLRFRQPLKLDFCRMTLSELKRMMDAAIREDKESPDDYWPIVAIGHTKELSDIETVESFLTYLKQKGIGVSTIEEVYRKCA